MSAVWKATHGARFYAGLDSAKPFPPDNPRATPCEDTGGGDDDDDDEPLNLRVVTPGDRMPGIPEHRFKAGLDYFGHAEMEGRRRHDRRERPNLLRRRFQSQPVTWRLLAGGFAHLLRCPPRVSRSSADVFDEHYGVFGTFFNLEAGNSGASADPRLGPDFFDNPRTITSAPPAVAYGGCESEGSDRLSRRDISATVDRILLEALTFLPLT